MQSQARVVSAVHKLRGIFLEKPGMHLSMADATRLSGLERPECRVVLKALEDAHFLERQRDGIFVRRMDD
jgi:hypothetical protein